jgi:hypothetical protein
MCNVRENKELKEENHSLMFMYLCALIELVDNGTMAEDAAWFDFERTFNQCYY